MMEFSDIERCILNGFSLDELEKRLKPCKPQFEDKVWIDTSSGGFLAPHEKLLGVVRADYDLLCSIGKTYEEMAGFAAKVLEYEKIREDKVDGNWLMRRARELSLGFEKFVLNRGREIERESMSLEGNVCLDAEKFTFARIISGGFQSCPWGCNGSDVFGYQTVGSGEVYVFESGKEISDLMERRFEGHLPISMNHNLSRTERDTLLKEFDTSLGIEFGGMSRVLYLSAYTVVTDLTPHLIASHYFFEGEACYRTDPRKLLDVVGLK